MAFDRRKFWSQSHEEDDKHTFEHEDAGAASASPPASPPVQRRHCRRHVVDRHEREQQAQRKREQLAEKIHVQLTTAAAKRLAHLEQRRTKLRRHATADDTSSTQHDSVDLPAAGAAAAAAPEPVDDAAVATDAGTPRAQTRRKLALQSTQHAEAVEQRRQMRLGAKRRRCAEHVQHAMQVHHAVVSHASAAETEQLTASRLQHWWRQINLLKALRAVQASPFGRANIDALSFEELAALMRNRHVTHAVTQMFSRLHFCLPHLPNLAARSAPRVFLSAFMMLRFPETVFTELGEAEQSVLQYARSLVDHFHACLAAVSPLAKAQLPGFVRAWARYISAFNAWQRMDQERLIAGLVLHYRELAALSVTVSSTTPEPAALVWTSNVQRQQSAIRAKLRGLGATQALLDLDALDAQHPERVAAAAAAATSDGAGKRKRTISGGSDVGVASDSDGERAASVSPAPSATATAAIAAARAERDAAAAVAAAAAAVAATTTSSSSSPEVTSASASATAAAIPDPEQTHSYDQLRSLLNAQLAHQIAIDPSFQLQLPADTPEAVAERAAAQAALSASLQHDLTQTPPDLRRIPPLIEQLCTNMVEATLETNVQLRERIVSVCDARHIAQQLQHGAFDLGSFRAAIVALLASMCAPVRDEAVAWLGAVEDYGEFFLQTLVLLRDMKMDLTNFHIQASRPLIRKHIIEYERAKFAECVAAGTLGEEQTRAWLAQATARLEAARPGARPTVVEKLDDAFVHLVLGPAAPTAETMPETMLLDAGRVLECRAQLQRLLLFACVHTITVSSHCPLRDDRFTAALHAALTDILRDESDEGMFERTMANVAIQVITTANHHLTRVLRQAPLPGEAAATLTGLLEKLGRAAHPVRSLMARRLQDVMRAALRLARGEVGVAAPVLKGFEACTADVATAVREVARIAAHNYAVYGPVYDRLMAGEAAAVAASDGASASSDA